MIVDDIPWRFLIGRTIYVKDDLLSEILFGVQEKWVLMYCFVDYKYGIQFAAIGAGSLNPLKIVSWESSYSNIVRYERIANCQVLVSVMKRMQRCDYEYAARITEQTAGLNKETDMIRKLRNCTYFDDRRMYWHPDLLEIPAESVNGEKVCVRLKNVDGNVFYGVSENKNKHYSAGEILYLNIVRREGQTCSIYASSRKKARP